MHRRLTQPSSGMARALRGWLAPFAVMVMLTVSGAVLPANTAHADNGMGSGPAKVVYHADFKDPRRFSAMLTSIYNMVTTYRNNLRDYDVRIVFNSFGLRFLTDDKLEGTPFEAKEALQARREDLKGRLMSLKNTYDVKLELCDITREEVGLSKDAFYTGVDFVASGVVRVAELQNRGFAYIKIE